jgi:hypothetical protein
MHLAAALNQRHHGNFPAEFCFCITNTTNELFINFTSNDGLSKLKKFVPVFTVETNAGIGSPVSFVLSQIISGNLPNGLVTAVFLPGF